MHPPNDVRPKWLTVAQLRRVLEPLPDDLQLIPNSVGNIAVCREDVTIQRLGEYVGYIDFLGEGEYVENRP